MNTKFTLGPWELGGTLENGQHCIIGDGDTVVALLPGETMHCTYKPDDARLIAAAPDLFDVALMLVACAEQAEEGDTFVDVGLESPLMHSARAAIAAATGDNP